MSAATFAGWRLARRRRVQAREPAAAHPPRRVLIAARRVPDASRGSIERLDWRAGRIEVLLRLEDGSLGAASLIDDDVNSLELEAGGSVFVLPDAGNPRPC
jgi:hypothetical protein